MRSIRRVAVLGAGTMGSRIAAHFSNAGLPVLLLDLPAEGVDRDRVVRNALDIALKQRPTAFFESTGMERITTGNFEDDLPLLGSCQWVLEAVTENLEIKRAIWAKILPFCAPEAILSTNTSGIPLAQISQDFPAEAKSRFLGTHFFNPPRYLHLLEVIPCAATRPELVRFVSDFGEHRLGKGIVLCRDTPNFIANRIGCFLGSSVIRAMTEGDYSIEEVDVLTGPLIGLPKSASFRLFDIIGLDVWAFVAKNLYAAIENDPWREWFLPPSFLEQMIANGWLGEKTKQGFYKRVGPEKQIHALDWKTLTYHAAAKPRFASVDALKPVADFGERMKILFASNDRAGQFLWDVFKPWFLYSAEMVGEISDRIVEIDRAMRWGFGHRYGPFEFWDALGFEAVAHRIEESGAPLPATIRHMLAEKASSFYRSADRLGFPHTEYFDLAEGHYSPLDQRPGVVILHEWKRARGVVEKNNAASLIDLGEGVLCLEFHSKMNAIGEDTLRMVDRGVELLDTSFQAMIITNNGDNFSVGANLVLLLAAAQTEDFDGIDLMIRHFQQSMLRLKYAPRPVVSAVFSRALGGGCEIVLQSHRVQASAETYIGLVEVGVGLIPSAGGCKEMVLRYPDSLEAFEVIGQGKVSGSAEEARQLRFLNAADRISMNPELLIGEAQQFAIELAADYSPGAPRLDIPAGGEPAYAKMRLAAWSARESGWISNHDFVIGEKLAYVLSGGRVTAGSKISEQHLLDLEREAFLSLCGMRQTQQRIEYMLKNGKPLRN